MKYIDETFTSDGMKTPNFNKMLGTLEKKNSIIHLPIYIKI